MATVIHPANIHDSKGAVPVIKRLAGRFSELKMLLADGGYRGPLAEFVKGTWMGFWSCTLLPRTCSQVCGIFPQIDHRKDILLDRKLQENDYRLRAKQWTRRSHVVPLFLPNPPWKKFTDRFKTACRITRDIAYTSADFCTKVYTAPLFLAPVVWTGHKNVCVLSFFSLLQFDCINTHFTNTKRLIWW